MIFVNTFIVITGQLIAGAGNIVFHYDFLRLAHAAGDAAGRPGLAARTLIQMGVGGLAVHPVVEQVEGHVVRVDSLDAVIIEYGVVAPIGAHLHTDGDDLAAALKTDAFPVFNRQNSASDFGEVQGHDVASRRNAAIVALGSFCHLAVIQSAFSIVDV